LTAKERLEAWKKQRELEKLKEGKATSATPEPPASVDVKPNISSFNAVPSSSSPAMKGEISLNTLDRAETDAAVPTAKPQNLTFGAMSTIGLPAKPTVKRAIAALNDDDDEDSGRKFQKLDLPEINPEPQSGAAVEAGALGDDLAAEDVAEEETKPEVKEEKMELDEKPEEDEEDELDAFMRQNNQEVREVNVVDAKRQGLLNLEDNSDDEEEIKDKAGDELAKAEALLQWVYR